MGGPVVARLSDSLGGFTMKLALHVTAISVLLAGAASAADLRRPAPVPYKGPAPVAAAYNWTGCYVGAGGGYGMYDQESRFIDSVAGPLSVTNDNGGRGWFGTVQVGCDYQIAPSIVIGAFGDYDFSGIKGDMASPIHTWVGEEKLRSSWAAGGRIGWVPWSAQQFMVYVSGGYTEARFKQVDFNFADGSGTTSFSLAKHTYSGWFIGTGYEYGLGFLPGLFWKTEYRYADYGSDQVPLILTVGGAPFGGDTFDSHMRVHTVRSEIVWRFNFGGPVVARY
jgi:outer membrane immunogenic protein